MSYGLTVKLLQDVLPLDEPLQAVTIRNHVLKVAQRLEDALGEEQWSFIDSCPAEWSRLPMPDGPLTVGIDGGYVKAQGEQEYRKNKDFSREPTHRRLPAPRPCSHWELSPAVPARQRLGRAR